MPSPEPLSPYTVIVRTTVPVRFHLASAAYRRTVLVDYRNARRRGTSVDIARDAAIRRMWAMGANASRPTRRTGA